MFQTWWNLPISCYKQSHFCLLTSSPSVLWIWQTHIVSIWCKSAWASMLNHIWTKDNCKAATCSWVKQCFHCTYRTLWSYLVTCAIISTKHLDTIKPLIFKDHRGKTTGLLCIFSLATPRSLWQLLFSYYDKMYRNLSWTSHKLAGFLGTYWVMVSLCYRENLKNQEDFQISTFIKTKHFPQCDKNFNNTISNKWN